MVRLLRRLVLASLLVGGIALVVRRRQLSSTTPASSTATTTPWPPMADPDPNTSDTLRPFTEVSLIDADDHPQWALPLNGACPDGYPIKANDNSRIFHVPGGRFYDRTIPERCYAEADAALADGYRAAKA